MKKQSSAIAESGVMSALVVLFIMIALYVPVIGTVALIISPIPIVFLNLRHDTRISILSVIVSAIILCMFTGVITGLSCACVYGLSAIALGECIKRKKGSVFTFAVVLISVVVGFLEFLLVDIYLVLNTTPYKLINDFVEQWKQALSIYTKLGIDISANPVYQQLLSILNTKYVLNLMPAVLIICGAIFSLLNYNITKEICKKFKIQISPLPKFTEWYTDTRFGAVLIITVCIGIMTKRSNMFIGDYIFSTGFTIFTFYMMIVGLAVTSNFLLNKVKMKKGLVIFICILLILTTLQTFIMILGITDFIVDFRAKDENSIGSALRRKLNMKE